MKKKSLIFILIISICVILTACAKIDISSFKYKIEFMVDNELYETIGTNGATIKMPQDPKKNNYEFKGWFWDDGIWNKPFTINSIMDQPIQEENDYKVYAKFISDICVVKYITGTSEIIDNINANKNTKLNTIVPNIVKQGHAFDGWYKDSEFKEKWNFDTDKVESNMNLYANWIKQELAIEFKGFSYDGFKYTLSVSNNTSIIDLSNRIIVKNNAPYTIHQYITGNIISDIKNIRLEEEVDNNFYLKINDNSIYGVYNFTIRKKPIYTVSFFTNGGTSIPDQKVEEGGNFIKPQNPTKENFIFLGWSIPDTTEVIDNITIEAYWKGINVRINFDANGGEIDVTYLDVEYYSYVKLPYPKKEGFDCIGWYDGETNIKEGYWHFAEEKSLSAKWRIAKFNISYMLNGGTNNTSNKEKYTMLDEDIILYEPIKKGYKFLGWYLEKNFITKITKIEKGSVKDLLFYARWELIEYDIMYHYNGGTRIEQYSYSNTYNYENFSPIGIAKKECYTFMGWSLSKDLTSGVFSKEGIPPRTFIGNINLYAVWEYGTEGLLYELNSENKYEVAGYNYNEFFDPNIKLVIPSKYNNIDVVAIRSQVFMNYRENIGSLVLCEGLKRIDYDAFYEFKKIKSITIPESVEFIGCNAFFGCELLETINFNAIACNNENAPIFSYSGFKSNGINVVIGNQVKLLPGRFLDTSYGKQLNINSIEFENNSVCEEIGEKALPIKGISNISLPKNLKRIQNYAFASSSIEKLHLPEGILYIGEEAFIDNINLQSIYIPKDLDQIAGSVFKNCPILVIYLEMNFIPKWWNAKWNIENLPIVLDYKNNDVALDGNVYFSYQGLRYTYNNGNVTYIKQFVPKGIVNIPNTVIFNNQEKNVTAIETDAFNNNTSLKEITLPDFLTEIDSDLFYQCSLLEKVALGKNTIKLGAGAFHGCTNLTKIIGSEQILEVGNGTFYNCSSLQQIKLPKIKIIKSCLFYRCSSLVNIELSTELTRIEADAFRDCGITNISLPTTLTYIGNFAFSGVKLQSIVLPNSVESLGTNVFSNCRELTNVVLPDNLKILPSMTFYQCYKLFNVVLPSFLESTESGCFDGTAITNIKFPSTLKTLGNETFKGCSKLISVDCSSATSINFRAFSNCISLKEVKLGKELQRIGEETFYRCLELKSLIISDSVDYIGESAFGHCENITLYFEALRNKENWKYSGHYSSPQEVFSCVLSPDKSFIISFTKNYLYDDNYRPLNNPIREGYIFGGWYNSPNFLTEIKDLTNYPLDSKVYIKWILI